MAFFSISTLDCVSLQFWQLNIYVKAVFGIEEREFYQSGWVLTELVSSVKYTVTATFLGLLLCSKIYFPVRFSQQQLNSDGRGSFAFVGTRQCCAGVAELSSAIVGIAW
jgi:hypothetical protein